LTPAVELELEDYRAELKSNDARRLATHVTRLKPANFQAKLSRE
jgi:hypothetical protein